MSVYTSEQYQILLDLSGLLTAAMTDSIFERTVSATLSTKMDRDQEFLFFTSKKNLGYSTSVSAAGIQIINTTSDYIRPAIHLSYLKTTQYTFDSLYATFSKMNVSNPQQYAKHYTSRNITNFNIRYNR